MWTIDARCSRCADKNECKDRTEILRTLSPLTNKLNTETELVASPGDGILIVACTSFKAE